MKNSKNNKAVSKKYDKQQVYSLVDAISMVKKFQYSKFDESVDLAINLDVDPRHAEENIRLTTPLPHGTGRSVSVAQSDARKRLSLRRGRYRLPLRELILSPTVYLPELIMCLLGPTSPRSIATTR